MTEKTSQNTDLVPANGGDLELLQHLEELDDQVAVYAREAAEAFDRDVMGPYRKALADQEAVYTQSQHSPEEALSGLDAPEWRKVFYDQVVDRKDLVDKIIGRLSAEKRTVGEVLEAFLSDFGFNQMEHIFKCMKFGLSDVDEQLRLFIRGVVGNLESLGGHSFDFGDDDDVIMPTSVEANADAQFYFHEKTGQGLRIKDGLRKGLYDYLASAYENCEDIIRSLKYRSIGEDDAIRGSILNGDVASATVESFVVPGFSHKRVENADDVLRALAISAADFEVVRCMENLEEFFTKGHPSTNIVFPTILESDSDMPVYLRDQFDLITLDRIAAGDEDKCSYIYKTVGSDIYDLLKKVAKTREKLKKRFHRFINRNSETDDLQRTRELNEVTIHPDAEELYNVYLYVEKISMAGGILADESRGLGPNDKEWIMDYGLALKFFANGLSRVLSEKGVLLNTYLRVDHEVGSMSFLPDDDKLAQVVSAISKNPMAQEVQAYAKKFQLSLKTAAEVASLEKG